MNVKAKFKNWVNTTSLLWGVLFLCLVSCNSSSKKTAKENLLLAINEENATLFAHEIERTLYEGEADFFNNAFDIEYVKKEISNNSIVYSSLDTEIGKAFFKQSMDMGKYIVETLKSGGDYQFLRYYVQDETPHLIFRLYADYGVTIDDYELHVVDNQIKIKNGFNYNLGVSFIDKIKYSVLYNLLQKTDPEGNTSIITKANQLIGENRYKEAQQFLLKNELLVKEYPHYLQLLLQSSYLANPDTFLDFLHQLDLDTRTIWIHQLLFYTYKGNLDELQTVINQLIDITGDDPIYLFFYGRANYVAKNYDDALICFQQIGKSLPPIWDIWFSQLECYEKLNKSDEFIDLLRLGEEQYALDENDLIELTEELFPRMLPPVKTYFTK